MDNARLVDTNRMHSQHNMQRDWNLHHVGLLNHSSCHCLSSIPYVQSSCFNKHQPMSRDMQNNIQEVLSVMIACFDFFECLQPKIGCLSNTLCIFYHISGGNILNMDSGSSNMMLGPLAEYWYCMFFNIVLFYAATMRLH